jgi:hypothetical protein
MDSGSGLRVLMEEWLSIWSFSNSLHGTGNDWPAWTAQHTAARMHSVHTGMDLIGDTSHACLIHQERSQKKHCRKAWTPATASELTDPV